MLYINTLEAWGWLSPSDWVKMSSEEKALITEIQYYVYKKHQETMRK